MPSSLQMITPSKWVVFVICSRLCVNVLLLRSLMLSLLISLLQNSKILKFVSMHSLQASLKMLTWWSQDACPIAPLYPLMYLNILINVSVSIIIKFSFLVLNVLSSIRQIHLAEIQFCGTPAYVPYDFIDFLFIWPTSVVKKFFDKGMSLRYEHEHIS